MHSEPGRGGKENRQGNVRGKLTTTFSSTGTGAIHFLQKYPRLCYCAMLCCIIISALLTFSVMRPKRKSVREPFSPLQGELSQGITQFLHTAASLKEVLALQLQIDSLLKKDRLNGTDSLLLLNAFEKMELLEKQLNAPSGQVRNLPADTAQYGITN